MEQGASSVYSHNKEVPEMTGLEIIQGMQKGQFPPPPIAELLNFSLQSVAKGSVVFKGTPTWKCTNPMGTVHGGWYGTILDSTMACSVITELPPGKQFTTLEFKVNLIRPIPLDFEVFSEGKVIHLGKTTAVAEANIHDSEGKVYALGTSTGVIFSPKI